MVDEVPIIPGRQERVQINTIYGRCEVDAWRLNGLAAHQDLVGEKCVVSHLPTGMSFGYQFDTLCAAVAAMLDIDELCNDWASLSPETLAHLAPKCASICIYYGGQ